MMPFEALPVLQVASTPIDGDVPIWAVGAALTAVTAPLLVAIKALYSRTCTLSDGHAAREGKAVEATLTAAHALDQLTRTIAEQKGETTALRSEVSAMRSDVAAIRARLPS